MADIPGLIEGAHLGQGLGIRFLKHVERTKVLVHLIDVSPYSGRNPVDDFKVIMKELEAFNPDLARRPQIIAANKTDLLGEDKSRLTAVRRLAARRKLPFVAISAVKSEGLSVLKGLLAGIIAERKAEEKAAAKP